MTDAAASIGDLRGVEDGNMEERERLLQGVENVMDNLPNVQQQQQQQQQPQKHPRRQRHASVHFATASSAAAAAADSSERRPSSM